MNWEKWQLDLPLDFTSWPVEGTTAGLTERDSEMGKSLVEVRVPRPLLQGHKRSKGFLGLLAKFPILHSLFARV